ncbi:MAG: hydrogenase 3 maturation endopeptidase HyCI [Candidatus Omnitrophica bacterium]|nr:hydrogenase 3 maturation endopeptidase HyCI [Candidatus Omnitrophota bacterium]MDD5662249.1 hydrogenase 3 maturation endopeptidase HyCI [Candidatus Omnitrophota bacterium]
MGKNSEVNTFEHLKLHLRGKVVIMGIGNTLRSDDGIGSILAARLQDKVPYIIYDGSSSPENYLGKIIKDRPDTILLIDAVDFGGEAGEIRFLEGEDIQTVNFFSTHDASISLAISYLKNSLKSAGIFILAIQPKILEFGDKLSPKVAQALKEIEGWFING